MNLTGILHHYINLAIPRTIGFSEGSLTAVNMTIMLDKAEDDLDDAHHLDSFC